MFSHYRCINCTSQGSPKKQNQQNQKPVHFVRKAETSHTLPSTKWLRFCSVTKSRQLQNGKPGKSDDTRTGALMPKDRR